MNRQYHTTKTAAEELEVSQPTIKFWCQQGKLPAQKMGKLWKIPVRLVEEMKARAERTGTWF